MKRIFCRFVRSYVTLDFRMDADAQALAERRKRTRRFEVLHHTAGKVSSYELH